MNRGRHRRLEFGVSRESQPAACAVCQQGAAIAAQNAMDAASHAAPGSLLLAFPERPGVMFLFCPSCASTIPRTEGDDIERARALLGWPTP